MGIQFRSPTRIAKQQVKMRLILFDGLGGEQPADSVGVQIQEDLTGGVPENFSNDFERKSRRAERINKSECWRQLFALAPKIFQDATNLFFKGTVFDIPFNR
jgi:hypothetical protein